jgi:hypothetical protein
LAQFLSGSQAGWLETFADHSYYGQLGHLSQRAILDIIDALITDDRLKSTGGRRPKVVLPDQISPPSVQPKKGAAAEATSESQPKEMPPVKVVPPPAPDTSPDPALLEALTTWRTDQARAQQMPPYIILPNKVLTAIATTQPLDLATLQEIPGIGPAKLAQYGAAIVALVAEVLEQAPNSEPSSLQIKETHHINPEEEEPSAEETTEHSPQALTAETPQAAILAVVTDLEGLLTPDNLVALLTAAPGEIVPFSDHPLCGKFHATLTPEELSAHLQTTLQQGQVTLSRQRRLNLP